MLDYQLLIIALIIAQQVATASDAPLTVDGVNVSRSTNIIDDLYDGFHALYLVQPRIHLELVHL